MIAFHINYFPVFVIKHLHCVNILPHFGAQKKHSFLVVSRRLHNFLIYEVKAITPPLISCVLQGFLSGMI